MKIFFIMFWALQVYAHGENTPGPHGGYIRMPGNYHTEVAPVPNDKTAFRVYLLDLNFKNPIVKNSEVKAFIVYNKLEVKSECRPVRDHFLCKARLLEKATEIVLRTKRNGTEGSDARYPLPLKEKVK